MDEKLLNQIINDTISLMKIICPQRQESFIRKYHEPLDVVNDEGIIIGSVPRGLIHRTGLRHRTVFVIVVAPNKKILLQTRGKDASSAIKLDISVGGHVISGETDFLSSSAREMEEELGFRPDKSRICLINEYNRDSPYSLAKPYERNRERRILYEYQLSLDEFSSLSDSFKKRLSTNEVLNFNWFSVEEVLNAINVGNVADGLGSNFLEWLKYNVSK